MDASGRYGVDLEKDPIFGEGAFVLRDHFGGSSARVIPSLGCNLLSFVAGLVRGKRLEVLLGPPAGEDVGRSMRYGVPILFPFPNRVRNGRFTFQGREYQLDRNTPEGHHSHGFVRNRPWRVVDASAQDQGAVIRCSFSSAEHPDVLRQYPFPFVLTVTYALAGNLLRMDAQAQNTGSGPLPMGFGLHPFFRLPLASGGTRADCLVHIPTRRMWELDEDKLPTGRLIQAPAELDFRTPRPIGDVYLDHAYTGLADEAGHSYCHLRDPRARAEVTVRSGREFRTLVAYAPKERPTICFEPYTCTTDAVNLAGQGIDGGLIVLRPGEAWRGTVQFGVANITEES